MSNTTVRSLSPRDNAIGTAFVLLSAVGVVFLPTSAKIAYLDGSNVNTVAEIKSGADPAGGELALTGVGNWLAPLGVALLLVLSGVAALAVRQHRGRP